MTIYDVTLTLSDTLPVWPGDPSIEIKQVSFISKGDDCNVSHLKTSVHAGTHLDAPKHFLDGAKSIDELDLAAMLGPAQVIQVDDQVKNVTAKMLESASLPASTQRILIKSANSKLWEALNPKFNKDFVALSMDAAVWLVAKGIKLVGLDYLSIAPFGEGKEIHQTLLKAGIILVEGLNLTDIDPGFYELICLPLKLKGSDGSPARVVLRN